MKSKEMERNREKVVVDAPAKSLTNLNSDKLMRAPSSI